MPSQAKTSAGKIKINLALDPSVADLLYELAPNERSVGAFVSSLITAEARYRREEELRARARVQRRPPSDLRDALERLEESEARYNRLVARMSAIVFEIAPDGTLLFVNQAIADITGFQPEELAGQAWRDLLFPGRLEQKVADDLRAFADDLDRHEVTMATKGGGRVVVEVSTANHYSRDGRLERLVGFAVDVSQRWQAEQATAAAQEELRRANQELERRVQERTAALTAVNQELQDEIAEHQRTEATLRERNRFIERVLSTSPHSWYIFDLRAKRRVWANRPVPSGLGYAAEQFSAEEHEFLVKMTHPEDATAIRRAIQDYARAAEGEIVEFEYRLRAADGSWHWYNSRASVFARDEDGVPTQILGVAQDITERKRNEAALRESQHFTS